MEINVKMKTRGSMMRQLPTFIAIGLLPALFLGGCQKQETTVEPIRPVKAVKVGDATPIAARSYPGRAAATQEVNLSFRVSGPLVTFPVKVGDEVKEGDLLARIDPRDFEVNLRNVQGQLERAKAARVRAQSEYDRVVSSRKQDPGAVSQVMVDRKRESLDRSKADIRSLTAAVDAAKDQLSYTYLRAPFSGTVVATYVENFETVRANEPIVRLLDTSKIEMTVDIPESVISNLPYVTSIYVVFAPFPDLKIPAEIKKVGKEASETTRTYPLTLIMDQPENMKILPGMAGRAYGESTLPQGTFEKEKGIQVPVSAVFSTGESQKSYVWVIDETAQTASRREVKTGRFTSYGVLVTDGLKPGEWVATAGVHSLREGQKVSILGRTATEES
jgi:RND family efflux transporter MFP subunit